VGLQLVVRADGLRCSLKKLWLGYGPSASLCVALTVRREVEYMERKIQHIEFVVLL